MARPTGNRFHALDAMRGLAALMVALYHFGIGDPAHKANSAGYLAVDFFFLLSGFVIARAYETRLRGSMSLPEFAIIRLIRFYPLYLLGLVIGCAKPLAQLLVGDDHAPAVGRMLYELSFNVLMLPVPTASGSFFPLNPPAWSLFFEAMINLVYAAFLVRAPRPVLVVVVAVSGLALAFASASYGMLDLGWGWWGGEVGVARVFFSFTLGVLFFRLGVGERRTATPWALLPMALLLIVLFVRVDAPLRGYADAFAALVVFPLLIWWSASMEVPPRFQKACALLGDLSYPLYTIHYPIAILSFAVMVRLGAPVWAAAPVFLLGTSVASFFVLKHYDEPARAWLSRKARRKESAPPAFVQG